MIVMAELPSIKIELSDRMQTALAETRKELEEAREALSEERIRKIVQEEIAHWEKGFLAKIRMSTPRMV
jgi:hypothetical protein